MIHEMLPLVNFITTISSFYLLRVNNNEGLVGIFVLKTQKVQKKQIEEAFVLFLLALYGLSNQGATMPVERVFPDTAPSHCRIQMP